MLHKLLRPARPGARAAGFTLIEVLIALGVLSIIGVGTASYIGHRLKVQKIQALQAAKGRVVRQVELALADPAHIKSSLEVLKGAHGKQNKVLLDCLMNGPSCPSDYFSAQNAHEMDYYLADNAGGYVPISGYWSTEGGPACLPPTPDSCPMQATIKFWVSCLRDRSTGGKAGSICPEISHVNLLFQLAPTPGATETLPGVNFYHPLTAAKLPEPEQFAISIPVKSILALYEQSCMSYHFVEGYGADGRIICTCLNHRPQRRANGSIISDSLGRPLCESNECPDPRDILIGFELVNGQSVPQCLGPSERKDCYRINLKTTPECADNYWISQVFYGECDLAQPNSKKKVLSKQDINCADDAALCCREYE